METTAAVREFVLEVIKEELDLDVNVAGDTPIGPDGLGLESIHLLQLCARTEDQFGVALLEDLDRVSSMSLDSFISHVTTLKQ